MNCLRLAIIALAVALAGCTAKKLDYRTMTAEELARNPDFMPVFPTAPANGILIGEVSAMVCQRLASEPEATTDRAIRELKRTAALRGARVLSGVSMRSGVVRIEECHTSASAAGTAWDVPRQ
jgi:hypothetical protein